MKMQKFQIIKYKKLIIPIILFGLLFGSLTFFYKRDRAQAQEVTICDVEIPIGESMDTTYDLLIELVEEHQKVYEAIPQQVQQARNMTRLANECDTEREVRNNCRPICIPVCVGEICVCVHVPCISKFYPFRAGKWNDACPTRDIDDAWGEQKKFAFSEVDEENEDGEMETVIDRVIGSSTNIIALIRGEDVINEDGRLDNLGLIDLRVREEGEAASRVVRIDKTVPIDENIRLEDEDEDDTIRLIEFIDRKLRIARQEFNECALTPEEISALQIRGGEVEEWPRASVPAYDVIYEGIYRLPERLADECIEPCAEPGSQECFRCMYPSLNNYYCCH